jgi:DNA-binding transcriptional ArsR family regulator
MNVSKPFAALAPSVDLDVLAVLAGSNTPRSGREIARRAGRSKTGVQHVLDRLVDHGLVVCLHSGRTRLYTLNRDHLLAGIVEQMISARTELIHRLRERIGSWELPVVHASLFGSAARGDGDVHSDIDLLIVRPASINAEGEIWRGQIDDLADSVRQWTGNHAGIAEVSEADMCHRGERPPVLKQVRRDAIDLAGEPIKMLLRDM